MAPLPVPVWWHPRFGSLTPSFGGGPFGDSHFHIPSRLSTASRAQVQLHEMIKLEVRVAAGRDLSRAERLIESACARAALFVRLKRTAAYPGSVRWHIGKERERGTLEITLWGRAGRILLKVHPQRTAAWIPGALRQLRTVLERKFSGR